MIRTVALVDAAGLQSLQTPGRCGARPGTQDMATAVSALPPSRLGQRRTNHKQERHHDLNLPSPRSRSFLLSTSSDVSRPSHPQPSQRRALPLSPATGLGSPELRAGRHLAALSPPSSGASEDFRTSPHRSPSPPLGRPRAASPGARAAAALETLGDDAWPGEEGTSGADPLPAPESSVGQVPSPESGVGAAPSAVPKRRRKSKVSRIGVLLLNLGGPETLDDVQPFLFNLFADPDIIRLPRPLRFLQQPLAQFISTLRAPKSREGYASIGGGSPLRRITMEQADALQEALVSKGQAAEVYVGMRYWHPFTEEAIDQIKADGIRRLVVLPLYPQFSITTSGSSLRLLEQLFRRDEYLVRMEHTVIPSWYQRRGYVEAMADLIEKKLRSGAFPDPDEANIFFSAHGVPVAYVEEAGDPYKAEMEECVALIMEELRRRGVKNDHTLAYQSRVGPVEWLKPYTDESIRELAKSGVQSLLAVPISFVSEHIETLEEIDCEYRELAMQSGVKHWGRVPALGCEPRFIQDLADAVIEALPYVGAMAASSLEARQSLVPLGSVEELLATYDIERRELPAPVAVWEWGWTKSAETWNGRVAMLAVLGLLVWEVSTGQGVLHQLGMLPMTR